MNSRPAWWTLLAAALATATRLAGDQPEALAARQILRNAGIEAAFVARIEGAATPDRPAGQVFSTLFVFEGVVWNYSSEAGTTILGRCPPGDENSPEALRPLLARIAPPGAVLTLYQQAVSVDNDELMQRQLSRACVIGCVSTLTRVLLKEGAPDEAGLVMFLFASASEFDPRNVSPLDHSVFVYRRGANWSCVDPREPTRTVPLERIAVGAAIDPMLAALARRFERPLQRSVYFPISAATLTRLSERLAERALPSAHR
jgi:hypothetical protein